MLLTQMVPSSCLTVKPKNLKRTWRKQLTLFLSSVNVLYSVCESMLMASWRYSWSIEKQMLGTIKILSGIQGRWLLRGENKLTLMLIRRLGPTVVAFCLMIITCLMTRMRYNTLWVPSSSALSTQTFRVVPITATTSTLHPLHTSQNLLSSIHFINMLWPACMLWYYW